MLKSSMDYLLLLANVGLLAYIFYQDYQNRKERERLNLKSLSKSASEYKTLQEKPKNTSEKPDPYVEPEDVPTEKLIKAKDKL